MTTFIVTAGMIILFILGIPVGYSLGVAGFLAYLSELGSRVNIPMLSQRMQYGVNNFLLLAIPLFILAAKLMNTAGITTRLFNFARLLVGFLPGGLGHANTVASLIFAGMSGAAVADAAGLGQVELKALKDAGYDPEFSVAITAASSTIGPIFPPSIPMVIFALVAEVSVGKLFLGGVVPGLLMTVALMVMVAWYAHRRGYPRTPFPGAREFLDGAAKAFLPILTPIILLGGIWSGQFTPTESAAVAVAYALVLGVIVYKELHPRDLAQIFIDTAKETAAIGIIICAANFFGWLLLRTGLTNKVAVGITQMTSDPLVLLILLNLFLLVVGCFMETVVAILIVTPMLMPVILKVGIDPLHFGVVMVLNLMIGLLTPPFGVVLFVMTGISDVPFERVVRATLPFLTPLFVVLALITFFPILITWLPKLVMG
ncbi:MAG: TRAP transporter large permease [Candidatus Methylomirabilota bacterium]